MSDYPRLTAGVDPGALGGIAFIGQNFAEAWKMPETEREIMELLEEYRPHIDVLYMESQHPFPGMSSTAMGTFMKHYGFLRGVLVALKIPFVDVSPMKWKKALGLNFTAQDSKKDKKNGSKELASQWWPALKITHATSEALLIASYGRRQK